MLKAKLKNHYLKKKIDQFSQTKSSSANVSTQKIKTVGIITSDDFFNKHEFSEILIKKLQLSLLVIILISTIIAVFIEMIAMYYARSVTLADLLLMFLPQFYLMF